MEDRYSKFIRLFGYIFFTFIGFIVALILLMLGLRLFFGLLSYIPWFVYVYMLFIVTVPSALFMTVYIVYFIRTKEHPSTPVRYISYTLFSVALSFWAVFLVLDLITFFTHNYNEISHYNTYNLLFLSCNVGAIFLTGILQAFATEKEVDWMEKQRRKELNKTV